MVERLHPTGDVNTDALLDDLCRAVNALKRGGVVIFSNSQGPFLGSGTVDDQFTPLDIVNHTESTFLGGMLIGFDDDSGALVAAKSGETRAMTAALAVCVPETRLKHSSDGVLDLLVESNKTVNAGMWLALSASDAGRVTPTPPSAPGEWIQLIGQAVSDKDPTTGLVTVKMALDASIRS